MNRLIVFICRYLVATIAHLFLVAFGWLPRYRAACYEATYQLGWRKRPVPEPSGPPLSVPPVEARTLITQAPAVRVLEQDAADGNVTGYELLIISQLLAERRPEACFEIGTFDGRTTLNLAANAAEESRVYTLDLPPQDVDKTRLKIAYGDVNFIKKESSGARFVGTDWEQKITQLYGDSASFDFTPYEGRMDMVFVDGAHSYDYVKNDTAVALRLLKPEGGLILWHDYGSPYWKDLTRALNELHKTDPQFKTMQHVKGTALVVWEKEK